MRTGRINMRPVLFSSPSNLVTTPAVIAVATPAVFQGLVALMTPVVRLPAVIAVIFDGIAQAPVIVTYRSPAVVAVVRLRTWSSCEKEKTTQRYRSQRCLAKYGLQQMPMELHNILLGAPPWLVPGGCVLFLEHLSAENVAAGKRGHLSVALKIQERNG